MTKKILSASFNYSIPAEELKKAMIAVAPEYADIPGCCWKIWIINEDRKEAGGVYLFESAAALELYLGSKQFAAVVNNPAFNNFISNTFGVLEAASVITGAPLIKMGV